jgi:predicted TIM-barrel fold metal-dependent hydrolase
MVVDAHIHYIEAASPERPYADWGVMEPISVDALLEEATRAGVDRIVQVTASTMGYDNRCSFEGFAQRPDRVLGVFGRFDPLAARLEERLESYWATPGALGIRFTLFHGWAKGWLKEGRMDPFFRAAAALDVPVAMHAPFQAEEMLATVRRHERVRFLVDHTLIRHEAGQTAASAFRHWPTLLEVAACLNVWTKVSYFPEAAMGSEPFPYPTAQERLQELHARVSADRLIWGSNFPPVLRACSYADALGFVRRCTFFSEEDLARVLGGTFLANFARTTLS